MANFSTYTPYPKQLEFHLCPAKFRLFGGARGPGKSKALLEESISRCIFESYINEKGVLASRYRPDGRGIHAIIIRTSVTDLEDSIISKFRASDWPHFSVNGKDTKFNQQLKIVTWPNGATLRFGYAANEKDLGQYLGADYAFIGIDELTLFPTYKMWIALMGALRCTVPGVAPCMAATTNPGNRGHDWVKHLFVLGKPAPKMEPDQYNKDDYKLIKATYLDGPFASDPLYIANLMNQPAAIRRAWIQGDWDISSSSFFDIWDQGVMTYDPDDIQIPSWCPRWISIDWGFKHAASVHWHALLPVDKNGVNRVVTYRELVETQERESVGSRRLGDKIVQWTKEEKISAVYLSPDAWGVRDEAFPVSELIAQRFHGTGIPNPQQATDDRKAGWMLMYEMLRDGEWLISTDCPQAIDALPSLESDADNLGDVLKTDAVYDDVGDDLRYGIQSRMKGRKPRKPQVMVEKEMLNAIQDPFSRYQKMYELLNKQKEQGAGYVDRIVPRWVKR